MLETGVFETVAFGLASVLTECAGTTELCRVLTTLNAMMPETATTCRSKTISRARESFILGSGISP